MSSTNFINSPSPNKRHAGHVLTQGGTTCVLLQVFTYQGLRWMSQESEEEKRKQHKAEQAKAREMEKQAKREAKVRDRQAKEEAKRLAREEKLSRKRKAPALANYSQKKSASDREGSSGWISSDSSEDWLPGAHRQGSDGRSRRSGRRHRSFGGLQAEESLAAEAGASAGLKVEETVNLYQNRDEMHGHEGPSQARKTGRDEGVRTDQRDQESIPGHDESLGDTLEDEPGPSNGGNGTVMPIPQPTARALPGSGNGGGGDGVQRQSQASGPRHQSRRQQQRQKSRRTAGGEDEGRFLRLYDAYDEIRAMNGRGLNLCTPLVVLCSMVCLTMRF